MNEHFRATPHSAPQGFGALPRDAFGHFVLNIYEAIIALMDALERLFPPPAAGEQFALDRYPFLQHYADEIAQIAPEIRDWRSLREWWRRELAAWEEEARDLHLPLREMLRDTGLNRHERLAFLLAGLVEEESRFGTLFAALQAPIPGRRPIAEVIGRVAGMDEPGAAAGGWSILEGLIGAGYLRAVDTDRARSEWALAVPVAVWDAARGSPAADAPASGLRQIAASGACAIEALDLPQEIRDRLSRLTQMAPRDSLCLLMLRSQPGSDSEAVAGALARALGQDLLAAPTLSAKAVADLPIAPVAVLRRAVPYLPYDLGPGETAPLPPLTGCRGLVVASLGQEGSVKPQRGIDLVTVSLPVPPPELRHRLWARLLPDTQPAERDAIATRFRIGSGHIRRAAPIACNAAALDGRARVTAADVRAAIRALGSEMLETHAVRLPETGVSWSGLICGSTTAEKLAELERRCHHRETLPQRLGAGFAASAGHGVRALFSGPSGTGKTHASRILAAAVGRDIFRVDLASVINKYIGETEKNLHEVLAHAEALDVVLLLDEGDSLLGRRTEVKSSNDRYANLETNYLLQRLESYSGILIVTTNLGDAIDSAFQRRMDVVVPFQAPRAEERRQILTLHLPEANAVSAALLDQIAGGCQLNGAQLRNAVQHAGLRALDTGSALIGDTHLMAALESEYRKSGSVFPLANQQVAPRHGGIEGFLAAFGSG